MNYRLLCDIFKRGREYGALKQALEAPVYEKRAPFHVSGLTEGAEYIFLASVAEDMASGDSPITLVFSDGKKASSYNIFLRIIHERLVIIQSNRMAAYISYKKTCAFLGICRIAYIKQRKF